MKNINKNTRIRNEERKRASKREREMGWKEEGREGGRRVYQ